MLGVLLYTIGIPPKYFPNIFMLARITGIAIQIKDAREHQQPLVRPSYHYQPPSPTSTSE